jgi:hypothetical protein
MNEDKIAQIFAHPVVLLRNAEQAFKIDSRLFCPEHLRDEYGND